MILRRSMKYMRNSSEITLLPARQLKLLVYQKMCSSRLSALQVEDGIETPNLSKGGEIAKFTSWIERKLLQRISHSFKIQRSVLIFSSRRAFYRTKACYKSLQKNTLHGFYHRLQVGFVQNFKPFFWCHLSQLYIVLIQFFLHDLLKNTQRQ